MIVDSTEELQQRGPAEELCELQYPGADQDSHLRQLPGGQSSGLEPAGRRSMNDQQVDLTTNER